MDSPSVTLPPSGLNIELLKEDHILNMSPRPSHQFRHDRIVHLDSNKSSNFRNLENDPSDKSITCRLSVSDGKTTPKSSSELVQEIATLEHEIVNLERYLLSLYRTAFQQGNTQQKTPLSHEQQYYRRTKSGLYNDHQVQNSPTSALAGPNDLIQAIGTPKSATQRDKKIYTRHRSLGDHLGNSEFLVCPDMRLSVEIIECISSIYCKLATQSHTRNNKVNSASSNSSSCSSNNTFSPKNLSGSSWSSQCNDEALTHQQCDSEHEKGGGPYTEMVEVLKICLDDETYSYAATMLQKFRSLVKSLENVDPKKMRREEKLAFWLNIHNALVMHAYLAYGTENYIKTTSIVKASYNVGGHCVNAYDIQNSILGIRSHYSAPWLQTLLSPGKKFKTRHAYAIEYPEPLVHFALSSGAYSDPAVRIYTANNIFHDLKVAMKEFIQATVYVHKETKIYLPKILSYYAKDMSINVMSSVLETVLECLVGGTHEKAIRTICAKGKPEKNVYWLEQSSSFRYIIHKHLATECIRNEV